MPSPDKKWLRKKAVAERYSITPRSVLNLVRDGRLPKPKHPLGTHTPYWLQSDLDEHDRKSTVERSPKAAA